MTKLSDYQANVLRRLKEITPYLQKFSFGDFSEMIPIPEAEDEFTELLVGINLMVEDVQESVKELKEKQRTLSNINNRQQALFKTMEAGLSIKDLDGVFKEVNQRFCDILGYSKDELIGKKTFMDITHPDDWKSTTETVSGILERGEISTRNQKRYVRKDGSPVWVVVNSSAIRDQDGKVKEVFSATQDITERVNSQEKMKQMNQSLAESVEELEKFNQIAVDREMRMIELKREINALHAEMGNEPPYDLSFIEGEIEDTIESP